MGAMDVDIPRDRKSEFEPALIFHVQGLNCLEEHLKYKKPINPYHLFTNAVSDFRDMLGILKQNSFLTRETALDGATSLDVLEVLGEETIINAVEAAADRWKPNEFVRSEVSTIAFLQDHNLWLRILDNGDGFSDSLLSRVGKELASSRDSRPQDDNYITESIRDHLYKMAKIIDKLGWRLVVENRREAQGASVSLVVPLHESSHLIGYSYD